MLTIQYGTPLINDVPPSIPASPLVANNQLNAAVAYNVGGNTVSVPGTFTYTTAAGTVLNPGNGQVEAVTFTPTDTTDFSTVFSTVTVNVTQDVPQVTLTDGIKIPPTGTAPAVLSFSSPYTGFAQPAMGTVIGANGITLGTPTISYYLATDTKLANPLPSAPTNVGNYLITGTFAALNSNYIASGDSINFAITAAAPSVTSVSPINITYGTALASSQLSGSATITLGGIVSAVSGTYAFTSAAGTVLHAGNGQSEAVTFTPTSTNFAPVAATVTVNVTKAMVTGVNPISIPYGTALPSGPVTGTATFTVGGTVVSVPGTYTYTTAAGSVLAPGNSQVESITFTPTDTTDYNSSATTILVNVTQLTPTLTLTDAGGVYTGSPFPAASTVTGVNSIKLGAATLTYYFASDISFKNPLPSAPAAAGSYVVVAFYPGSTTYSSATASKPFSITQAPVTFTISDAGGAYTGVAFAAAGTVTGAGGLSAKPTFTYAGTGSTIYAASAAAPISAGTYTVIAAYSGDANHLAGSSSALPFTITAAGTSIKLVSSVTGSSNFGQSITFTATVTAATSAPTPPGSVQFFSGTTLLATVALTGGTASYSTSSLALGSNSIIADYVPASTNYSASTTSLSQTVGVGLLLLDTTGSGALSVSGGARVVATGTTVVVDSSSSTAITASGGGQVTSSATGVVGKASITGGASVSNLATGHAVIRDPFASLSAPTATGLTLRSSCLLSIGGSAVVTLQPGLYIGGISIAGAAKVTLAPGEYYLQGGGLAVSGSGSLTDLGKGVLIYNAAVKSTDQINISGAARVNLSSMTTGIYAGIAIFQARTSNAQIVISGSGSLDVVGTVYAADALVNLSGAAVIDTFGSSLIADDLLLTGSGELLV